MIREKPSTQARKLGYAKLNILSRFLFKLLHTRDHLQETYAWGEHPFLVQFNVHDTSWRDYMLRHIPADKRGGPARALRKR